MSILNIENLDFGRGHGRNFDYLTMVLLKFWPWSWSKIVDHLTMTPGRRSNGQKIVVTGHLTPLTYRSWILTMFMVKILIILPWMFYNGCGKNRLIVRWKNTPGLLLLHPGGGKTNFARQCNGTQQGYIVI